MDQTLFTNLLMATLLAIIGLLSFAARGVLKIGLVYLESKVGVTKLTQMKETASTVVRALRQSPQFEFLGKDQLKVIAMGEMQKAARYLKLPVDNAFLDKLIEEAVQIMKSDLGENGDLKWDMEEDTPAEGAV